MILLGRSVNSYTPVQKVVCTAIVRSEQSTNHTGLVDNVPSFVVTWPSLQFHSPDYALTSERSA